MYSASSHSLLIPEMNLSSHCFPLINLTGKRKDRYALAKPDKLDVLQSCVKDKRKMKVFAVHYLCLSCTTRVKRVTQTVTDEINTQYRNHDQQAREEP